ncbi:hypothetical protein BDR04DRAFT_1102335, partial [Suillus decipiens]
MCEKLSVVYSPRAHTRPGSMSPPLNTNPVVFMVRLACSFLPTNIWQDDIDFLNSL